MVQYSKAECENLVRSFVAITLDDEVPDNKCFTMCYILSIYLSIYGISNIIKSGTIITPTKEIHHYIITLEDNNFDIDPTAKQIDFNNPQVLMREMLYPDSNLSEINFENAYQDWKYPLIHDGSNKPLPVIILQNLSSQMLEIQNQKINVLPYLRILIRAYYFFEQEIIELECKGQQIHKKFVNLFFEETNKIAIQNIDKRGKFGSNSINNRFENLLDNYSHQF